MHSSFKHYFQQSLQVLALTIVLASCTSTRDSLVSPGRIMRADIPAQLQPILDICDSLDACSSGNLEIVAHGAGSYRYYPMEIDRKGFVRGNGWSKKDSAKNITDLIDLTFKNDEITSIEIDVQAPPHGHVLCKDEQDCLFILHNGQKKWKKIKSVEDSAVEYLQANTLRKTLRHFVDRKYYQNKRIYIEIKSARGCNAAGQDESRCTDLGTRVALEIRAFLEEVDQLMPNQSQNWISIISFSATGLEAVREALPAQLKDKVDYVLIAGLQRGGIKWLLGQAKGSVPVFDKNLRNFAANTPWLDRVWFSVQGIPKFSKKFQKLADQRTRECTNCDPLSYSVATYPFKVEKFREKMTRKKRKLAQQLSSMMIDIDDEK